MEHNVQLQIEETGFTPQILVGSEPRNPGAESAGVSTAFFSIKGGDDPKILRNYIFENDGWKKSPSCNFNSKHSNTNRNRSSLKSHKYTLVIQTRITL